MLQIIHHCDQLLDDMYSAFERKDREDKLRLGDRNTQHRYQLLRIVDESMNDECIQIKCQTGRDNANEVNEVM
jgi:hypothetical protein